MTNNKTSFNKINYSFIKLISGYDLFDRRLPFMSIKSQEPGPAVWLTGCMHGDEIGGTVIIHELFKYLKTGLLKGSVYSFPLMNPFGFENASRHISLSDEDLNRAFPGKPKGTLAQRMAYQIFSRITQTNPDVVLDLHNDWNKSIPYALIDAEPDKILTDKMRHIAEVSGLVAIQESEKLYATLTYNLLEKNIPALTLELGESLLINEKNITYGFNAIWNILADLNMVEPLSDPSVFPIPDVLVDKILKYSSLPLCSSSGIIRFLKKPGELVKTGDKIAKVSNAFGKLVETITAVNDGIILGHNDYAIAYPGSPVMAFGVY
ncbi:MAG: succinylglutamate desuccinylase/aspartoacylase family protein [Spirochaetales bacterium]|nr:succinylglutamate desuccinylase/aspartoacylase family protein [Spirochaetales bacterium]